MPVTCHLWRHPRAGLLLGAAMTSCLAYGAVSPASAESAPTLQELQQALQAQQKELERQKHKLDEQASKIANQEQKLATQEKLLAAQQNGLKKLTGQFRTATSLSDMPLVRAAAYTGQNLAQGSTEPQAPQPVAPEAPQPSGAAGLQPTDGKAESFTKPREQLLLEAGGILLPPGVLQIEPSLQFTHVSSNQVNISGFTVFQAIVIGTIEVNKLNSDLITGTVTGRLGLPYRTQLDVEVPGLYRRDTTTFGIGTSDALDHSTTGTGLGDIQVGLEWQPIIGHGWIPDTVLRMTGVFPTGKSAFDIPTEQIHLSKDTTVTGLTESPTGSGFYVIEPGFTTLWKTDPVAFYAGATYKHAFAREVDGAVGNVAPGDTVEVFAGLNLAVSDQVALNLGFDDQVVFSSSQNGVKVPGSSFNDGRAILGASLGLTPDITLVGNLQIGLTQQSPDFVAMISLPITFNLF